MTTDFSSSPPPDGDQFPTLLEEKTWGTLPDGRKAKLFSFSNNKMQVEISNFGGIIHSIKVPDRHGRSEEITLGFDQLDPYLPSDGDHPYFGALVGRYANRIGHGQFILDGKTYQPATTNNGPHCLHGGKMGFDRQLWSAEMITSPTHPKLILRYSSPGGEEGFPGTLQASVTFELTPDQDFKISYRATTDQPTVVNLTHHPYFNLGGIIQKDCLGHEVFIHADHFLPIGPTLIPTGEIWKVQHTPMDFTHPKKIEQGIHDPFPSIKIASGFDHNWVLNKTESGELSLAARVKEYTSGREMEIWTTNPGVQFYTGNFLSGLPERNRKTLSGRDAFCLETQYFPDSPNISYFPSTVLRPGQLYQETTIFKFRTF